MKRKELKKSIGNKVRFIYARVGNFSTLKDSKLYNGRTIFSPTILLTNLYAIQNNGKKINIDHVWINITDRLLNLKLAIDDTLSFTARPLIYEKKNNNGKVISEIGIKLIFNIKILSRTSSREKSFDNYLIKIIKNANNDNGMLISDGILKYYNSLINKEEYNENRGS